MTEHVEKLLSDRVVLLCGISGSGKTVFARALEQKGYERLSVDGLLWSQYGDAFASLSREEQGRAFGAVWEVLARELDASIAAGRRVVVDSTLCKRAKRDAMREVCRSHGIEPKLVYMSASKELLARRLASRKGLGPDDQIVTPEQLASYCAHFEAPAPDEETVIVEQER